MKLLQILLWMYCPHNCVFCSTGDEHKMRCSSKIMQQYIDDAIHIVHNTNWTEYDSIAISGGEVDIPLSAEIFQKFQELVDILIHTVTQYNLKKCYFMSSLLGPINKPLQTVISKFQQYGIIDKLMINTSYDTKWRFTDITKTMWLANLSYIEKQNIPLHIEIILTDDMMNKYLNNNKELNNIFMKYSVDFIRPTIPAGKHKSDLPDSFFPTRKVFFAFLDKLYIYNRSLYNDMFSIQKRATKLCILEDNKSEVRDYTKELESVDRPTLKCGHNTTYKLYSDSDRCIFCDYKKHRMLMERHLYGV